MNARLSINVLILSLFAIAGCGGGTGAECRDTSDCEGDLVCSPNNTCLPEGTCIENEDCGDGFMCSEDSLCVPATGCASSDECLNFEECDSSHVCVNRTACDENDDCDSAEFCSVEEYCIPDDECRSGDDCTVEGEACIQDTCSIPGPCTGDLECPEHFLCDTEEGECVFDDLCGEGGELPTFIKSDVMVVLDRSFTMRTEVAGTNTAKWTFAVNAVSAFADEFGDESKMGMVLFPDPIPKHESGVSNCNVIENVPVPATVNGIPGTYTVPLWMEEGNASIIKSLLQGAIGSNPNILYAGNVKVTNILPAIEKAELDPNFGPSGTGRNMLLITDGMVSCPAGTENDIGPEIAAMKLAGINTYVVGFGSAINRQNLTEWAVAGGTDIDVADAPPLSECKYLKNGMYNPCLFYLAEDGTALLEELLRISAQIRACSFGFSAAQEPNKNDLEVFLGLESVPLDLTNTDGWNMSWADGEATVTYHGSWCDKAKAPSAPKVGVFTGCDVVE